MKKCIFDKKGVCYALACYSNKKCGAKDNGDNPIYATLEAIKKAKSNKRVNLTP